MSDDARLARLEARVEVLERLVREVLAAAPPRTPAAPSPPPPSRPSTPTPVPVADVFPRGADAPAPSRGPLVTEQWLGQKALLTVGVVFLILAAGYLLKLSFDRGWISPLARCVGGALGGAVVGVIGWRLHGRGLRTYGAALLGTGAAIIYLAVWAAARLYQFLPPGQAVAGLALVSLGLAAVAWAVGLEALLATAALGAFLAPLLIGEEAGSADLLLAYLGTMGAALGWVAAARRWRVAMFIVAAAYYGLAVAVVADGASAWLLWFYAVLGGSAGLFVGLREGWVETRLLAFTGGWSLLAAADTHATGHWPNLIGGLVLSAPVWWRALRMDTVWPGWAATAPTSTSEQLKGRRFSFGESFYFYVTPLLLGVALWSVARDWFNAHDGAAALLVALPYLAAGYQRERRPFALVGMAALAVAALEQDGALLQVWLLAALSIAAALTDHVFRRTDGRVYALLAYGLAVVAFGTEGAGSRPWSEPAFTGPTALTLWGLILVAAAQAARLVREDLPLGELSLRRLFWAAAGVLLFLGVSVDLIRLFEQRAMPSGDAALAAGLAVSAWWIIFAAGCFAVGFRGQIRALRLTGFAVAGLAVLKVVFVDLATLDALYRVGSAFILGLVSLAIAYAYHRRVPE
jgi:uncharacterized membrane protein